MDKYGHAWRVGDMSLCLTVLVGASSVEETITFKMCTCSTQRLGGGVGWGGTSCKGSSRSVLIQNYFLRMLRVLFRDTCDKCRKLSLWFPHSLYISSFSLHLLSLSPFPLSLHFLSLSMSSFSLHFLILSLAHLCIYASIGWFLLAYLIEFSLVLSSYDWQTLSWKDAGYTFSGVSPEPVGKQDIHKFFIKFREQVCPI